MAMAGPPASARPAAARPLQLVMSNIADMAEGEGFAVNTRSHSVNGSSQVTMTPRPPPPPPPPPPPTKSTRFCPRPSATAIARTHEQLIADAREHYTNLGYRVHSGLQFGCELVLYADHPQYVHSDFCVLVLPSDGRVDWRRIQCLTRSMPDYKKTLILAEVLVIEEDIEEDGEEGEAEADGGGDEAILSSGANDSSIAPKKKRRRIIKVKELAVSTEHAPFRHRTKKGTADIGSQRKKQKTIT